MLRREDIKRAIEAISERDGEAGYALGELLEMDRIRPAPADRQGSRDRDLHFTVDGEVETVRRFLFFNQATAPIEERLLLKYGEMRRRHRLERARPGLSFHEMAIEVRDAGRRFLLTHEIDRALAELKRPAGAATQGSAGRESVRRLEAMRERLHRQAPPRDSPVPAWGETPLYTGTVGNGRRAHFMCFPFCPEALLQAAEINLEFFSIRFLLSCLTRGLARNLFACLVGDRLTGMVFLRFKSRFLYRSVEIAYLATLGGGSQAEAPAPRRKPGGVGTLLTAGVWLLWQDRMPTVKALLLDAEIGARPFYEKLGFQPRGMSGFVMRSPRGRLVSAVLEMAARCPHLGPRATRQIEGLLEKQIHRLGGKNVSRKTAASVALALFLRTNPTSALSQTVRDALRRLPETPETAALLAIAPPGGTCRECPKGEGP